MFVIFVANQAAVPYVFARRWMLVPWMPAAWANSGEMEISTKTWVMKNHEKPFFKRQKMEIEWVG